MATSEVNLAEILELTGPLEEVQPLMEVLMARLAREGVPGLISMQFYTNPERRTLAGVLCFSDPAQMVEHTKMISGWDEFKAFAARSKLVEMRIHGHVSDEVKAWMAQFRGDVTQYAEHVAGFRRTR